MTRARIIVADVMDGLRSLPDGSVQCCITSPPYWGLRDYGQEGQLGLEATPEEYVARMVEVFAEVRRVLRDNGVCFLNLGDSYASQGGDHAKHNANQPNVGANRCHANGAGDKGTRTPAPGLKPKDLVGIPWRVAFALQADGWWLRSEIIWAKPNPMPESVTDRPTKAHEYIFLLAKAERYFWDQEAVKEAAVTADPRHPHGRGQESVGGRTAAGARVPTGWDTGPGSHDSKTGRYKPDPSKKQDALGKQTYTGFNERCRESGGFEKRNLRSVWTIATQPFSGAHFATFPQKLVEPMVKAGSAEGDTVLDPFCGAGTTGLVALKLGRDFIGIELNPDYAEMAAKRIRDDAPLFNEVEVQR